MEYPISRSAFGGSLEQFPTSRMTVGTGSATTFSNRKTPRAPRTARPLSQLPAARAMAKAPQQAAKSVKLAYRPRFWAHLGFVGIAAAIVISSSPAHVHNLSVRLLSSQAGIVPKLDSTATAQVAADMAVKSGLMVTSAASKTATTMSQQVALLTSDDTTLAKRQVVSTAGDATRSVSSYVVQPGDTLSAVASKFNITSSTVTAANNLDANDDLTPGQSLTILPISGLLYTVAAGDTPASLAAKYSANAAQIVAYNVTSTAGITTGEKIIIPDGVMPAPVVTPTVTASTTSGSVAGAATLNPKLTSYVGGVNGYDLGYCTYYVATRRSIPSTWGNANQWLYNAEADGFSTGSVPVPGAIAWTGAGYYGHVAYVESVSGGMVTISEMNYNGNWDKVTERTVPASSFSYIY